MPSITYQNHQIPYTHRVNRRLKHVYLQVNSDGVLVKSSGLPLPELEGLILKKAPWIIQKLEQVASRPTHPSEPLEEGSLVPYLGQKYPLRLQRDCSLVHPHVELSDQQIWVALPDLPLPSSELTRVALDRFMKQQAARHMIPRLMYWGEQMQLFPTGIQFKRHKSRWGSCSHTNNINLNYQAIQLPPECIDLILVHELAHIKVKNHSPAFWALVERHIPNYQALNQMLRRFPLL